MLKVPSPLESKACWTARSHFYGLQTQTGNVRQFHDRRPRLSPDRVRTLRAKTAPPIGNLLHLIEKVIKATWKYAEPSADSVRDPVTIGTRGGTVPEGN